MTIKFKKASQKELAEMNIDAMDFAAVEAVEVNGQMLAPLSQLKKAGAASTLTARPAKCLTLATLIIAPLKTNCAR